MSKILFFNPKSAEGKSRFPNSILSIAATIEGKYDWAIVDGNREAEPLQKLRSYMETGEFRYIGFTVMPGPQTKQAIPFARRLKEEFPSSIMIWGGYFPGNHYQAVLESGCVDFVINGPGEHAFPKLIDALEYDEPYELIQNLIYKSCAGEIIKTSKEDLFEQDPLPPLPYDRLDTFYSASKYLGKTFLGNHTMSYHSSIGCPFKCAFCAVVPYYEARWKAKSAKLVYDDVKYIKDKWGADAIEFTDNNFFVSEKRAVEFAKLIRGENMSWWGMARIDTMDKYSDESLAIIREAGCKIIFFGAESGNNLVLKHLDKGGTQTGDQILHFAGRLRKFGIIPEYSFILGTPGATQKEVMDQIDFEIGFIKKVKKVNPDTEIIIYLYSPVATEGSDLYNQVRSLGFEFPTKLEDWISPQWEGFDIRRNPLTPWLRPYMIDKIRNFETVLNGYYPTVSDIKLNPVKRQIMHLSAGIRYNTNIYNGPYEVKLLQKLWKYRQPELSGF
ncbi:B12-binding domain-containing radical SAM protein [Flavihumibacter sp. R14]|nr:B12-binding domain-containing radical SAM protein [Flavihumibacter soli]